MTTLKHMKCSMPNCHNTVGQHSKQKNVNKQVCSAHRNSRKNEVDKWKMDAGCANKNGKYGFPCTATEILDPVQLDINHVDGNNDNRDEKNVEVLCCLCHRMVTLREEHHKQPKQSRRAKIVDTGLFTGLIEKYDQNISYLMGYEV
jgi:hypothetical protein